jgi:hypothetical protein
MLLRLSAARQEQTCRIRERRPILPPSGAGPVVEHDVVVYWHRAAPEVAVVVAVLHGEHPSVESGEHGHADVHLPAAADDRVLPRVAGERPSAARPVESAGTVVNLQEFVT